MALKLKSLLIFVATATLISGREMQSGTTDFGTVYSSSKLDGSGIKISTDFGKELTLEEFKKGYNLNKNFGQNIGLANNGYIQPYNFDLNSFNSAQNNFDGQYLISNQNQQATQQIENSNTETNIPDNNNGESNTYTTQNIPQQYQVIVNRPSQYPLPHHIQVLVPVIQKQEIQQQNPQTVYIPAPSAVENNEASTEKADTNEEQNQQSQKQMTSHESETTINNGFVPMMAPQKTTNYYYQQQEKIQEPQNQIVPQYLQQKVQIKSPNYYPQIQIPYFNKNVQYNNHPSSSQHGFQFSLSHVVKPALSSQYFYTSLPTNGNQQSSGNDKYVIVKSGPINVANEQNTANTYEVKM